MKLFDRYFLGPVKLPLNLFSRDCRPEDGMKWQIPKELFERKVQELMKVIELNDGNHRYEAYTRLGIKEYYVIVWITEKEEYAEFMEKYSGDM